mmetsp:Transcript_1366/g.2223  ORF Transcript_1366/g.2223 Transcript_1366/m.2223 type:complete len:253 (-) Transcript_1366:188-946(-)|eukprot:CAMPEP_0119018786 /NCGR_PEP_ID=MMETSP1176-20130426/20233_1 /TAXON_ID=265551 /ORGANISM="Synedropsis recta cf, Strain CCMP1620" /LENGTH=252 /DNA_ID=CAMNT_0006972863 /DNA_START=41 /DNA_END=799 /DNA_ORIENTATION=+
MTLNTAVPHDGSTPRKTNRSCSSIMISSMMPSSIRQLQLQPTLANNIALHIPYPYISHATGAATTRQSHETPRHNSIVQPRTIIQRSINIIAPEERNSYADAAADAIDDKDCFVMHRKLLRRRHVRKVQKEQMIRRQREAQSRKRRAVTPEEQPVAASIQPSNSFSDLTTGSFEGGSCNSNNNRNNNNSHIRGATTTGQTVNRTTISNNGALLEHNSKDDSQKNAGSAFKSTPLLYSPLRSSKRRRLFVSAC